MTNISNNVLYIGVTSDLTKRVNQHKNHEYKGFSDKYNCTKLVYFEECNDINAAIKREKQLKNWHREWKKQSHVLSPYVAFISSLNFFTISCSI